MSDTEVVTRRGRAERPEREVHREEPEPKVLVEDAGISSPEDALAETARQLRESNEQLTAARQREVAADRARREAEVARDQAAGSRAQDRLSVVAAAIETAKADGDAATLALRTAREAGDFEAEVAAQRRLNAADFRFNQASAQLEFLKNEPKQAAPQQGGPSPAAQRWLDEHPRYQADADYRRYANGLHNEALQSGLPDGSQAYVDYIEREMAAKYGVGHGSAQRDGGYQPERRDDMSGSQRRGDGAPPSRGSNGAGGGGAYRTVRTGLGDVQVQDTPGGGRRVRMSSEVRDRFEEGARLNRLYDRDPVQALAEYTNDHIEMALENYTDDAGSYFKRGDGELMR